MVEGRVVDQEGIVTRGGTAPVVKVQREAFVDLYGRKRTVGHGRLESRELRKEGRAAVPVSYRHDSVVQLNAHSCSQSTVRGGQDSWRRHARHLDPSP